MASTDWTRFSLQNGRALRYKMDANERRRRPFKLGRHGRARWTLVAAELWRR